MKPRKYSARCSGRNQMRLRASHSPRPVVTTLERSAGVARGSHLIAADDNILFGLMYLNLGAGERPDVDLILEGVGGARLGSLAFNFSKATC